jgi:2-oxo-4-hydroxy-4-carboxy-5-ureidoimidazoline decarboxylase
VTVSVAELDAMPEAEAAELFASCCGASRWVAGMVARRPFGTRGAVLTVADRLWETMDEPDWREAFSHHPRIGEQTGAVPQTARGQAWSGAEQSGMDAADEGLRRELAEVNREYEQRFGYIYIVCAEGMTAEELLALARRRLANDPGTELRTAYDQQGKIMRLRLEKLLRTRDGTGEPQ